MFPVLRNAETAGGGGAAAQPEAPLPIGGPNGAWPDLREQFASGGCNGPLTDDQVRSMLADCSRFLWQLTMITSGVMATVDVGKLRGAVAAEMPVPVGIIDENGKPLKAERPPAAATESTRADHRKEPRGRKHPLMVLVGLALQAVRLLQQITAGTNPGAQGKETPEDKRVREELKASEKHFRDYMNGKI